jgi:phage terminase large subunit
VNPPLRPGPIGFVPPPRQPSEDLVDLFDVCYEDPPLFFAEVLRKAPRRWQREVLEEIAQRRMRGEAHTQVHVRAAHFAGKGWLSAGLVLWWMATRPGARCLTTAPTWRGVEELLWTEIRKLYAESLLAEMRLGRMLDTKWDMGHGWFAVGASSDKPENLEGQHSMVAAARIVDEAKAVVDAVFTATEGLLASPETLDVWISTPAARAGAFYRRDMEAGPELIRKVVTIEDLIADGVPGATHWKESALVEYGGEHTFEYQSRANAQYIDNAEGALFPFSWIERAMDSPRFGIATRPTLGYDVAGSADGDENAVSPVRGPDRLGRYEADATVHWHQRDTQISKDKVMDLARERDASIVRADVQGLGKGVCDAIRREVADLGRALTVDEYRAADPAQDPQRFLNRKAEDAWNMRLVMERDGLRLPAEPALRRQMAAMRYEVRQGKIRIVDPAADSPDHFDAVLIGIGSPYVPISMEDVSFGCDFPESSIGRGWGDA